MNFQRIFVPIAGAALVVFAHRAYGWPGVAVVAGAIVMWALLHVTRLMNVLKRAANQPIGHVASAVMLNAKLKPGFSLMHVIAMTKALGALQTIEGQQPAAAPGQPQQGAAPTGGRLETYRWTDSGDSFVNCEFKDGKLVTWALVRPAQPDETPPSPVAPQGLATSIPSGPSPAP